MSNFFEKISDHLYLVHGENHGRFPLCNGLLIDAEKKVLVDTGFGPSRREAILESFDIDIIINTHYHLDHTRENGHFPHAEIWAHHADAPAITYPEVFYTVASLDKLSEVPDFFTHDGVIREIARKLNDGDILDFGGITLKVIHAPGHTPGHIALFEPKQKILFSADVDLTPFGPWYGNANADIDDFLMSIEKLADLDPSIVITGHSGTITESIPERFKAFAGKIHERDEIILTHLNQGKTFADLAEANIIYPSYSEPEDVKRHFEEKMLEKHLTRLFRQGKVRLFPLGAGNPVIPD